MSDSSDDGLSFQIRNYEEDDDDSEEDRPSKRRRVIKQPVLRSKGLGFVSAKAQEDEDIEEDDPDDERPTMRMSVGTGAGIGMGMGMGSFGNTFKIGEYNEESTPRSPSPEISSGANTPQTAGRGPSAFGAGGRIQKNSFAARMMAKQGYVEGQGLGKSGQGITAPIQTQMLQNRAGLGHGSEPVRSQKPKQKPSNASRTSTPGITTPKIKAPPKAKYNVSAIESRGLHVPDAMKSIIVDATGAEAKTVSSLSGFSTPNSDTAAPTEAAKASSRIKMQLQAYADAWDSTKEQETRFETEEMQLEAVGALHSSEAQRYQDIISEFERVSMDDSGESRAWEQITKRLQEVQERFADYIEELDLSQLTTASLEAPFRRELVEWEPLLDPTYLVDPLQSIGALLELEKATRQRHRRRTTTFETLMMQHWYPRLRTAFKHWNVYDPEAATSIVNAWSPILPSWLLYKVLDEIILSKLIEAVRRFPKTIEMDSNGISSSSIRSSATKKKRTAAPGLHSWLFDWWPLLSDPDLDLERFPELRHLVKSKVDSETWPIWKPLLGTHRPKPSTKPISTTPVAATTAATITDDVAFKDIVEEWCAENDLMLRSTGTADALGRLLYRLQDAGRRSRGILIYIQEDVLFDEDGEPYGLDDKLVNKALRR